MASSSSILELNETEKELSDIFLNVSKKIGQMDRKEPEVRFAGGWVRDKLLRIESHDIDVAIDCMSGFEFAQHLQSYLAQQHPDWETKVIKIDANPLKSKHLETATARIMGMDIDIVNLRHHDYTNSNSSNKLVFGTPLEDALRRDATINALFYNLKSKTVEDFTGKGLVDLSNKIIRTPLVADETFGDDPLRAVRCIRFATKYDFNIHEETIKGLKNPELHERLRSSISRERIGVEVDKMLKHCNTNRALKIIHSLGMFACIFGPLEIHTKKLQSKNIESLSLIPYAIDLFGYLQKKDVSIKNLSSSSKYIFWLAIATLPWYNWSILEKSKIKILPPILIRDSLKYSKPIMSQVENFFVHYPLIMSKINVLEKEGKLTRLGCGRLVRELGPHWRDIIDWAFFMNTLISNSDIQRLNKDEEVTWFHVLVKHIEEYGMEEAYNIQPIINGNEITRILGIRPGPHLRKMLDDSIEWRIQNPESTKEDYIAIMLEKGTSAVVDS
ncbi:CTP 3'-tRNA nucleotidyltransferase Cca1 [Schizosaccharomyces pombe]|uniref:tRNA nucleotidyltransferase cca1 n=1 Tax=Schizosaccharomyces pombe (strain 972 / ATCC 24843) TaxID=284812 RepID=CCA1_SCHPO|nr:putative tRNA nucleotidyltransferase [Schizosaccharomyces pombe]Q9UTQ0.2 RecName: Full=tRNA nucleotidyltransferase cca1; AltName: Full=CC-adding enzyme cca1; AltName: Full=tRNA cytidyltransferase cca1 [Schizosaccharomyces pombe 972h-]CAB60249.2 tRNA nucleotidyltransferase (predicted) [Schizosaccharomyces pombe]|eukprot:NP_594651.2 putative tRNA nucleotidyltransferase [Schizosaccharomyces pombe]